MRLRRPPPPPLPTARQVGEIVRRYFKLDRDPYFCVGASTVIDVVCHAAGIAKGPGDIAALVREVMIEWGAMPAKLSNRRIWKHVRPVHMTRQEASWLSAEVRHRKYPAPIVEADV